MALVSFITVTSIGVVSIVRNNNKNFSVNEIQQNQNNITISITSPIENKELNYSTTGNENTFDILTRLKNQNKLDFGYQEFSFGVLVDSIDGYKTDTNKEYWNFEVNGTASQVGIKDYYPIKGDKLSFKIEAIKDYVE